MLMGWFGDNTHRRLRVATLVGVGAVAVSSGTGLLAVASAGGTERDVGDDTGTEISFVNVERPAPEVPETPAAPVQMQPNLWGYSMLERERAFDDHQSFLWEGGDFAAEKSAAP